MPKKLHSRLQSKWKCHNHQPSWYHTLYLEETNECQTEKSTDSIMHGEKVEDLFNRTINNNKVLE